MKVALCLPCYGARDPHNAVSLRALSRLLDRHMIECEELEQIGCPDIGYAHNGLLTDALNRGATRVMIIDSDMTFDPLDALRLLVSEHDFVGANYARKRLGAGTVARGREGGAVLGELVEADFVASGFLSLSRAALERMAVDAPYYVDDTGALITAFCVAGPYQGRWASTDEALSRRWQALGEVAWIDTSVKVGHVGPHIFRETP